MTRRVWACQSCGWEWPLQAEPPEDAECDSCGGPLERVSDVFVAIMDTMNVLTEPERGGAIINRDQAEAMCRLLIDSGDMTPMAQMQLRKLWEAPSG